jgi:hypothetical protein
MGNGASADRRRAPRTSSISGGRFVAQGTSQNCLILNISILGARIVLLTDDEAPESMVLYLPGRAVGAARRRWQRGTTAGFEFVEPLTCPLPDQTAPKRT